jgi:hypothetical protein
LDVIALRGTAFVIEIRFALASGGGLVLTAKI